MKTTLTKTMFSIFGAGLAALTLAFGLAGCGDGYTTQEAYATCREILPPATEEDEPEVFTDCVACHENCGTDCNSEATSPTTFTCPDEQGEGGSGSGSDDGG